MPARGSVKERSWIRMRSSKPLVEVVRLEHDVAEARAGRDVDLGGVDLAHPVGLGRHLLVARQTRPALGLAGLGVGADPLELALEHLGALGVLLALDLEAVLLGLEVRRVVALVGVRLATVELEDPAGDVVEEVPVVGHGQDGAGVGREVALEPLHRLGVEVVGGLVEQQQRRAAGAAACTARPGGARHRRGCRPARRAAGSAARPSPGRAGCRGPTRWRGRGRSAGRPSRRGACRSRRRGRPAPRRSRCSGRACP